MESEDLYAMAPKNLRNNNNSSSNKTKREQLEQLKIFVSKLQFD